MSLPKPGSHLARYKGCTCDMIENQFGLGVGTMLGTRQFLITPGCPLHEHGATYYDEPGADIAAKRPGLLPQGDRARSNASTNRRWRDQLFQGNSIMDGARSGLSTDNKGNRNIHND